MKTSLSIITIGLCLLASACCTKKACDSALYFPQIAIEFKGFDSADLSAVTVITLNASTKEKVDSVTYNGGSNIYKVPEWTIEDPERELKEYSFIIRTNISADTIDHINYNKTVGVYKCNKCYPFGATYDSEIKITDLSYRHEKKTHIDTLVIKKN